MQNSAGLGSILVIQPVHYKNTHIKMKYIMGIAICESGMRSCPESVGVGKFCRLRLRLRLRAKQPTPTDSDSDSDSAPLPVPATARGTCRGEGVEDTLSLGNSTTAGPIAFKFGV